MITQALTPYEKIVIIMAALAASVMASLAFALLEAMHLVLAYGHDVPIEDFAVGPWAAMIEVMQPIAEALLRLGGAG